MTTFSDRQRAHEAKFAQDQDAAFRTRTRAHRLMGQWAAEQLGKTGEEAENYVRGLIKIGVAGESLYTAQLHHDLDGVVEMQAIDKQIAACTRQAQAEPSQTGA